jgi:oligopeptidase B
MHIPPVAKAVPRKTEIHGYILEDDYFWLREKGTPEVTEYLEAENAYTETLLQPLKPLRDAIYGEMLGRIKQTDLSVPAKDGDYWYYSRTEEGKQYPVMCRRFGTMDGPEEVLLELNQLAEGHSFLGVGAFAVSNDARWLAYSLDTSGYRQFTLHVKDLRTGAVLPDTIERVGTIVWANDNRTLFFTTEDAVTKRTDMFWRRRIDTGDQSLVYHERDELYDLATGRSHDRQMLFVGAYAKTSREIRYLAADDPGGEFRIVLPREPEHEYDVDHYRGEFYITTNKAAKNFRVVRAPIADPSEKHWTPFIPHDPAVKIETLSFFRRHIVVSERERGLNYLRVIHSDTGVSHRIEADEPDYAMGMGVNPEFDTASIRFTYQSMVTPPSVYEYQLDTRDRTLLKRPARRRCSASRRRRRRSRRRVPRRGQRGYGAPGRSARRSPR